MVKRVLHLLAISMLLAAILVPQVSVHAKDYLTVECLVFQRAAFLLQAVGVNITVPEYGCSPDTPEKLVEAYKANKDKLGRYLELAEYNYDVLMDTLESYIQHFTPWLHGEFQALRQGGVEAVKELRDKHIEWLMKTWSDRVLNETIQFIYDNLDPRMMPEVTLTHNVSDPEALIAMRNLVTILKSDHAPRPNNVLVSVVKTVHGEVSKEWGDFIREMKEKGIEELVNMNLHNAITLTMVEFEFLVGGMLMLPSFTNESYYLSGLLNDTERILEAARLEEGIDKPLLLKHAIVLKHLILAPNSTQVALEGVIVDFVDNTTLLVLGSLVSTYVYGGDVGVEGIYGLFKVDVSNATVIGRGEPRKYAEIVILGELRSPLEIEAKVVVYEGVVWWLGRAGIPP